MAHGSIRQQLECRVILNIIVFDHAAMPVRRVLAQTHVRNQQQVSNILAYRTQRLLHDAILIISIGADLILFRRDAKQQNATDPGLLRFTRKLDCIVSRDVELPGHGADFGTNLLARTHKNRINHGFRRQSCFTNQIAKTLGTP